MDIRLKDGRRISGDEAAKVIEGIGKLGRYGRERASNALPCATQVLADHFGSRPYGTHSLIITVNDGYPGTTKGRAKHVAAFLRSAAK